MTPAEGERDGGGAQFPLIVLIAGEPSGDALGGRLMAALKRQTGGRIRFAGVGGARMTGEGLTSLFPMADLAVMGLVEVVPRLRHVLGRIRETASFIAAARPAAVVTIDAPDFNVRVWRRVRPTPVPLIHYVAPTVWAWRPWRARTYAALLDHLLVVLPFEPPYFLRAGLPTSFVGHPVLECGAEGGDGPGFRARTGIVPEATVLCVLPGSRAGEITRHLPVFRDAVARLAAGRPGLWTALPTVPHLEARVRAATAHWPTPIAIVADEAGRFDAMAAADVALAASGTVALELAMARVPMVIGYRLSPVTAALAKLLVRVRYANLVNLLLDRDAIPELLLGDCRADRLAEAVRRLLSDPARREAQRNAMARALEMLRPEGQRPSEAAARVVLERAGLVDETT